MAQCHADGRKAHPSAMDLYVGCLHSKLYSPNRDWVRDSMWSRYNVGGYNAPTMHQSFHKEALVENYAGRRFGDDLPMDAASRVDVGFHNTEAKRLSCNAASKDAASRSSGGDLPMGVASKIGVGFHNTEAKNRNAAPTDAASHRCRDDLPMGTASKIGVGFHNTEAKGLSCNAAPRDAATCRFGDDLSNGAASKIGVGLHNTEAKSLSCNATPKDAGLRAGKADLLKGNYHQPDCNGNRRHNEEGSKLVDLKPLLPTNQISSPKNQLIYEGGCKAIVKTSTADPKSTRCNWEPDLWSIQPSAGTPQSHDNMGQSDLTISDSLSRLQKSGEQLSLCIEPGKSGEVNTIASGSVKVSPNHRSSNCSLNRGNLAVGNLIVGGWSSADSASSNGGSPTPAKESGRWSSTGSHGSVDSQLSIGGSPTSKDAARRSSFSNGGGSCDGGSPMAKDGRRSSDGGYGSGDSSSSSEGFSAKHGFRRPCASTVLNYRDSFDSVSSRGMGNIMTGGNNSGNVKVLTSKSTCNGTHRSSNCNANKSGDGVGLNSSCNLQGVSTPRLAGEGNIMGRPLTGSNVGMANACIQTSDSSSSRVCKKGTRSSELEGPEELKIAGNEQYKQGNFSEAMAFYDKAIAMCPNHAPYRSNKAAALLGLGRLGEAVLECEEAIRLDPSFVRARHRAALLYLRLGLVESAKQHFQAAGQQVDLKERQNLEAVERHISKCIEARKHGEWKIVLKESNAALGAGADSAPQIFGYKSEALLRLRRPEEADQVCATAQRVERFLRKPGIAPADSFLYMLRAQIDMALGRFEGAISAAEFALRMDPRNGEAAALLRKARAVGQTRTCGNELFKSGKFFEACAVYGEGLESDPTNAVLLCNRAACRTKLGQWEKAIEDCDAALNAQPNYTKALMRRAACSSKLERWDDALRDFEVLRREMPGDMEVARGLFDVQVAIKKSRGEEIHKMKFGGDVEEVNSIDQFREAVSAPGLSVVQFGAKWNDRCGQMSPFVDQLCKRYPCVSFVKVDIDDNPYLAKTESISFVPTFKIYKNGHKVKELLGPSQQSLEYALKHYSL